MALWTAVGVVAVVTIMGALKQSPAVSLGSSWGVLAAEQAARGYGGTPTAVRMADPGDLSRSRLMPITWEAPSNGWAPYIFRSTGMNLGEALRTTFLAAWAFSALGWIGVFYQLGVRGARLAALALVFVATRFVHSSSATYEGGEVLLLATFPWALLLTLFAWRPASKVDAAGFSFSAGLFLPILALVKSSAAVPAGAVGIAWILQTARGGVSWKRLAIFSVGFGAGSLLLNAWGNLGTQSPFPPWEEHAANWDGLWFFADLPLAPTDLDAMLRWLLMHPSRPVPEGEILLAGCGGALLLALLLLALLRPAKEQRVATGAANPRETTLREKLAEAWSAFRALSGPQMLALTMLLAVPAGFSALALGGSALAPDPRFLRPAALMGLAVGLDWLWARWRSERPISRGLALLLLGALFVAPLIYGLTTLVDKTLIRAPTNRGLVGMCGVRLDALPPGVRAADFREDLLHLVGGRRAVYWVPTPTIATEFVEERLLVTQALFQSSEALSHLKYRGRPEGGVLVVYPDAFAGDGRLARVLRAFRDIPAAAWTQHRLPRCPGWNAAFAE